MTRASGAPSTTPSIGAGFSRWRWRDSVVQPPGLCRRRAHGPAPQRAHSDSTAADSLLEAAGWRRGPGGIRQRDGQPLAFDLLTVGSADNAIEQLIQSDLAARGIDVSIRQMELGAFLTAARSGSEAKWQALITGIPGDLALSYVGAMFDGAQQGGSLDYGDYHTAALDRSFAAIRAASTDVARHAAWIDVQKQLADSVPVVWIYHARGLQGISARLGGCPDGSARRIGDRDIMAAARPAGVPREMTLLLSAQALVDRRVVVAGALEPLARSLAADLKPVLSRPLYVPEQKALLSRDGGAARATERCSTSTHSRRTHIVCPRCGEVYSGGELHDRFWIYWYQLWLAERAVHAALLAGCRQGRGAQWDSLRRVGIRRLCRGSTCGTQMSTMPSVRRVPFFRHTSSRSGCCNYARRSTSRSHPAIARRR